MGDEGKRVYLVGPRRMLNESLSFLILSRTGINCFVAGLPAGVRASGPGGDPGKGLVLFDCQGPGLEDLPGIFEDDSAEGADGIFLALFNLPSGANLEQSALKLGVRGFFYEDDGVDTLLKGIDAIFKGEFWATRRLLAEYVSHVGKGRMPGYHGKQELTQREMEVLALLVSGASNRKIAEKFCISPHTVKTHLYRIFKKIKVRNRLQAAQWASGRL